MDKEKEFDKQDFLNPDRPQHTEDNMPALIYEDTKQQALLDGLDPQLAAQQADTITWIETDVLKRDFTTTTNQ